MLTSTTNYRNICLKENNRIRQIEKINTVRKTSSLAFTKHTTRFDKLAK
jgi:hypothetical protein